MMATVEREPEVQEFLLEPVELPLYPGMGPLQTRWVDRLLKNWDEQCKVTLYEDGAMCALGVLCHEYYGGSGEWQHEEFLSEDELVSFGMTHESAVDVTDMNDTKKMSFPEIAEAIRRNPERFFEKEV